MKNRGAEGLRGTVPGVVEEEPGDQGSLTEGAGVSGGRGIQRQWAGSCRVLWASEEF